MFDSIVQTVFENFAYQKKSEINASNGLEHDWHLKSEMKSETAILRKMWNRIEIYENESYIPGSKEVRSAPHFFP